MAGGFTIPPSVDTLPLRSATTMSVLLLVSQAESTTTQASPRFRIPFSKSGKCRSALYFVRAWQVQIFFIGFRAERWRPQMRRAEELLCDPQPFAVDPPRRPTTTVS
jgi:hypothetical protein